jgi:hypothetical protein
MRYILMIVALLLLAAPAYGQQDVLILPNADGSYTISCHDENSDEVKELCFRRVDVEPDLDLSCMSVVPNATASITTMLDTTPGQDAQIKCFAGDRAGNTTDLSPNDGIVDFTFPNVPIIAP